MILSFYIPICDAIVALMPSLAEVAIHDIELDSIVYINGSISKRKVGDPSLLDRDALDEVGQAIYSKINFYGRLIKSISIVLEDKWLLCINCDVSIFSQMQALGATMLQGKTGAPPQSLFINDWQERLHKSIYDYIQKHRLSFEHLTGNDKKDVVIHLFELGAFNEKKAADYIAEVLGLGRATIFKYLKELRKQ